MKDIVTVALIGAFGTGVLGGWFAAFVYFQGRIESQALILFDEWVEDRLQAEERRRYSATRRTLS